MLLVKKVFKIFPDFEACESLQPMSSSSSSRVKTPSPYSSKDTHSHDSGIGSIEKHGKLIIHLSLYVDWISMAQALSLVTFRI